MKIAVCDGDVKACREIRRMLDRYGEKERVFLETELFSESGALCQEAEAGKRYDLIFLEVRPKSGGTEAGRRFRLRCEAAETSIVDLVSEIGQTRSRQFWTGSAWRISEAAGFIFTEKANFFIRSHIQRFCSFRAQGEKSRYIHNREFMNTMENCRKY